MTWKVNPGKNLKLKGKKAGCLQISIYNKYIVVGINNIKYMIHKVIFLWMTGRFPAKEMDHINCDGTDNRWENLREATRLQNSRNKKIQKNNTTGFKGVVKIKKTGKFTAQIGVHKKIIYLGSFPTPQLASEAYNKAAKKYHKEFANIK
jgi:hypothetical protein